MEMRDGPLDEMAAMGAELESMRVDPDQLDQLLHPTFDPSAERNVVGRGEDVVAQQSG